MRELIVNEKYNNKKITTYLLEMYPNLSLNLIYKTLRKKDIKVNDKRISENIVLNAGDNIKVYIADEILLNNLSENLNKISNSNSNSNCFNFDIIYEDENILILNKPSGIEVLGENSLTSKLEQYYKIKNNTNNVFIYPCHRLDRNTFGLIIYAKNKETLDILFYKFKNHEIEKHYLAKVYGVPKKTAEKIYGYLFKDSKKALVYISDAPKKGYERIITSYKVKARNFENNTSILDVTLHTGKTHQIRAHLAHIGYPIIGDGKYGINKINRDFKKNTQQLCSYYLKFNFKYNNGILDYLSSKSFELKNIDL